MNWIVSKQPNE